MAFSISLGHLSTAVAGAWSNPAVSEMKQNSTTMYGTTFNLHDWEVDMLGSMLALGTLPGCWLWGWLGALAGRRFSFMVTVLPSILGWSLIAFALNPTMILIGRFFHGVYLGSIAVLGHPYIVELSDISNRGMFCLFPVITALTGNILCTACGFGLHWFQIPFVGICLSIIVSMAIYLLPESPTYLVVKGKEKLAMDILKSLREPGANIEEEMKSLSNVNDASLKQSFFRAVLQRKVYQPIIVICTLYFIQNFGGYTVFLYFTTRLIIESGIPLDENIVSITIFSMMLFGAILSTLIIEQVGRKRLMVGSMVFMFIFLLITGGCLHPWTSSLPTSGVDSPLQNGSISAEETFHTAASSNTENITSSNWVAIGSLLAAVFSSSMGLAGVPWLLSSEYFPTAVRSQACGVCSVMYSVFNFGVMQLFSSMQQAFTAAGLFIFYGGVCFFGSIFSILFVTETKNHTIG